jgi:glycerate kinase
MRIVIAPDDFTGTLSARQAATAMAEGWRLSFPNDEIELTPLSDGGPGFVEGVSTALGLPMQTLAVTGPLGHPVAAKFLVNGECAYIESAQACGLAFVEQSMRDPRRTTSFGVGELIREVIAQGARQIVVGLGGTGTNDAGAGMLAALGATATHGSLTSGGAELAKVSGLDISRAQELLADIELILASDVDNPLLGLRGATSMFARQKGADDQAVMQLEGALTHFSALAPRISGKNAALALGAGAGGGLGFGLLLLRAKRVSGLQALAELIGLAPRFHDADLILTGEGCIDDQTLHGKVVMGVAQLAANAAKPCVAIGGQVRLGKRELASAGIDAAYDMSELVGTEASTNSAYESLVSVSARVAKTWGRR